MIHGRRILVLSLHYAPEPLGNAPYVTSLVRGLAERGAQVHAVVGYPHYPQWERYPGYRGRRHVSGAPGLKLTRLWHWIPNPPRGMRRFVSELSFGLHQVASSWSPADVAVLASPALFSTFLCVIRLLFSPRTKRVIWVQDLYSQGMVETGEGGSLANRVVGLVESWTLRRAHLVVAIHATMARRLVEHLDVSSSRVAVVPNWSHIAPEIADPQSARARLGWSSRDTVVLHAGNLGRKQGLGNVVEAAQIAQQDATSVRFILLGDGSERAGLQQAAAECPNIDFVDPLPDAEFRDAMAAADLLLVNELPGVREMAVPSKLTSYFSSGRPVLAAVEPTGTVAGIIESTGAGRVVKSGDPGLLLDAVIEFAADPIEMARAAQAGIDYWREQLSERTAIDAWSTLLGDTETASSGPK